MSPTVLVVAVSAMLCLVFLLIGWFWMFVAGSRATWTGLPAVVVTLTSLTAAAWLARLAPEAVTR